MWYPRVGENVSFDYKGGELFGYITQIDDFYGVDGPDIEVHYTLPSGTPTSGWFGARYLHWEEQQKRLI